MKIYLSPSNQPHNAYTGISTNEKAAMEALAERVKFYLERDYGASAVMATLSMGINKNERPTECKNKGCDFYLAIHSNAGGGGKASGTEAYYHPDSKASKELAGALVKELDAIAPIKSNRRNPVINGMAAFNGAGYGEVRSPMQLGVPSLLLEVNFHDNPTTAKWLVNSRNEIAQAIVKSIARVFNLKKENGSSPEPKPDGFFPEKGYFSKGDSSDNVGKIASFMRRVFPSYTDEKALGNLYGDYLIAAITEFQRRTGLNPDGMTGPLTLEKLREYGFNPDGEAKPHKPSDSFLPARGYFQKGDVSPNVGKIADFMYRVFPAYTDKRALGNIYGDYLIKSIKEFQKRTNLNPDGYTGPLTLAKLEQYGFKR